LVNLSLSNLGHAIVAFLGYSAPPLPESCQLGLVINGQSASIECIPMQRAL